MKRFKETSPEHGVRKDMQTKLNLLSDYAKRDEKGRLDNLAHLLSEENLKECFKMLKKGKAAGIDCDLSLFFR